MERWIQVEQNKVGLWTAILYQDKIRLQDLGGSYPKSQSATLDARISWGFDLRLVLAENIIDEPKEN